MKFRVSGMCDMVCTGCGGTTRVAPKRVYDTDDLACNCAEKEGLFKVTGITDITLTESGYSERLVPDEVYDMGNLSDDEEEPENVIDPKEIEPASDDNIDGINDEEANQDNMSGDEVSKVDSDIDEPEKGLDNANQAKREQAENPKQAKMFEEEPENVIDPKETDMSEDESREYLKSLGWPELLEAAKNNGVTKPPKANRAELEDMIIQKVFHE